MKVFLSTLSTIGSRFRNESPRFELVLVLVVQFSNEEDDVYRARYSASSSCTLFSIRLIHPMPVLATVLPAVRATIRIHPSRTTRVNQRFVSFM